jgi:hypothetical protein
MCFSLQVVWQHYSSSTIGAAALGCVKCVLLSWICKGNKTGCTNTVPHLSLFSMSTMGTYTYVCTAVSHHQLQDPWNVWQPVFPLHVLMQE